VKYTVRGASSFFGKTYHAFDRKKGMNYTPAVFNKGIAEVAEQADAHDSKSCSLGSVGSIPTFGIHKQTGLDYSPARKHGKPPEGVLNRVPLFYLQSDLQRMFHFSCGEENN
jgi:hypothetical protein